MLILLSTINLCVIFSHLELSLIHLKIYIFFLFSININSISLYPTEDPFKSPEPFNNNLGAFSVGILYLFVIL